MENPISWLREHHHAAAVAGRLGTPVVTVPSFSLTPAAPEKAASSMSVVTFEKKLVNALEEMGKEFTKGLSVAEQYLPVVSAIAALAFPGQTGAVAAGVSAVNLVYMAVTEIEQKYAASGIAKSTESNQQKLADVTALVSPTVIQLLATEGVKYDTAAVQNLINLVVAALKTQLTPIVLAPAPAPVPAAA